MKQMRRIMIGLFIWVMIFGLSNGYATPKKLIIYHTSDIHGYIKSHRPSWAPKDSLRKIGGFEALSGQIAQEGKDILLLDSGDFFQGAPEGTLSKGQSVIRLMNALGYDAGAIGNHEYDFGEDNLQQLADQAQFPLLAANIQLKDNGQPVSYAQPWALIESQGVKVGVVGLATRFTSTATLPKNVAHLRFVNEVEAAKPHIQALRAAGAEIVIALTHCGIGPSVARKKVDAPDYRPTHSDLEYPGDLLIAQKAGVDLVLGGHAHTALSELWRLNKQSAWIGQSGEHLEHTTRIVVTLNDGQITDIKGTLIELWKDQYTPQPKITSIVNEIEKAVSGEMDIPIGEAKSQLMRFTPPYLDGPLSNLFCDIMEAATDTDFAIHNSFGLRADLPAGPLTVGSAFQLMPFENTLVTMKLSGAEVYQLIKQNIRGGVSRLQVSKTLSVHVTPTDQTRQEAKDLTILMDGKSLDMTHQYTVAMNSYMAQGGSCCRNLLGRPSVDTSIPLRILFIDAIKRMKEVVPPPAGRINWGSLTDSLKTP